MILYLDTSTLVKLYVDEAGTEAVCARVDEASSVVTARVAYAEARAAFARHRREGALTAALLRRVVAHVDQDWPRYTVVEITDSVVRRAGALAERHALRGYDAIHLAAALEVHGAGTNQEFACCDVRLNRAARREGLTVFAP